MGKLHVHSKLEAVAFALRNRLVEPPRAEGRALLTEPAARRSRAIEPATGAARRRRDPRRRPAASRPAPAAAGATRPFEPTVTASSAEGRCPRLRPRTWSPDIGRWSPRKLTAHSGDGRSACADAGRNSSLGWPAAAGRRAVTPGRWPLAADRVGYPLTRSASRYGALRRGARPAYRIGQAGQRLLDRSRPGTRSPRACRSGTSRRPPGRSGRGRTG